MENKAPSETPALPLYLLSSFGVSEEGKRQMSFCRFNGNLFSCLTDGILLLSRPRANPPDFAFPTESFQFASQSPPLSHIRNTSPALSRISHPMSSINTYANGLSAFRKKKKLQTNLFR